jgi:hypothetical protein
MNIEKHVCSLPLAKRLKELGVEQKSTWYWNTIYMGEPQLSLYNKDTEGDGFFKCGVNAMDFPDISDFRKPYYSAFSGTELGILLPDYFIFPNTENKVKVSRVEEPMDNNIKNISYMQQGVGDKKIHMVCSVSNYSDVEARAIMLVYLLEHKLVTAAECNERLAKAA